MPGRLRGRPGRVGVTAHTVGRYPPHAYPSPSPFGQGVAVRIAAGGAATAPSAGPLPAS